MDERRIYGSEHSTIVQASGYRLPGYLIVEPRRDVTAVGQLRGEAGVDFLATLSMAETVLERLLRPPRIYLLKFGEMQPRLHLHVVPRTEAVGARLRAAGEPEPLNGARVTDWIWREHASLGHTDDELRTFVERARALCLELAEA